VTSWTPPSSGAGRIHPETSAHDLLALLESNPAFQIIPLTIDVAADVASLGEALRDSADRTIVSTARLRKLRLLTSDQRIIDSKLVPVVA